MEEPVLDVINVCKNLGKFSLRGISFSVQEGQIVALVGPNGAGKTTTIRVIVGLLRPDRGYVKVRGIDVHSRRCEALRYLTYVPDTPIMYGELKVLTYLRLVAEVRKVPKHVAEVRIQELVERFELKNYLNRKLAELSRGTLQKVAIVSALLPDFDIIVLDEPFNNLDPVAQYELKEVLKEIRKRGKGILLSSHIMGHVEDLADKVVLMYDGRVVLTTTPEEIVRKTGSTKLEDALVRILREAS